MVGLLLGASTSVDSSGLFMAVWMVVVGAGMGLALATSTSAALVELSPDRSGVGSGALEAINEVGGPFGIAILGSVVTASYVAHLSLSGLYRGEPPALFARASLTVWQSHTSSSHPRD